MIIYNLYPFFTHHIVIFSSHPVPSPARHRVNLHGGDAVGSLQPGILEEDGALSEPQNDHGRTLRGGKGHLANLRTD